MGQFSWKSVDTNEAIRNNVPYGTQTVTMVYKDLDGVERRVTEKGYEGYGVFGGVDFYDALSWMTPFDTNSIRRKHSRDRGINLFFSGSTLPMPQLFLGKPPENINFLNRVEDDPNQGWGEDEEVEEDDDDEDDEFDYYNKY